MSKSLVFILAFVLACGHWAGAAQIPLAFGHDSEQPDNSNLILASLHSLLKSWSQAYAPHGFAVVPATIKPGTLLYHMNGPSPPTGMDWFAFDAEHSYVFGGGFGVEVVNWPSDHRTLYTFAANRPLHALYFDGFSAAKMGEGTLDLQNVFAYGNASGGKERSGGFSDFERGRLLCEWGKQFGIEGFVREEATFELLWCNFTDGVQLVDSTNATGSSISEYSATLGNHFWEPSQDAGPPRRRPPGVFTPYAAQARWSFYHAASWHHHIPESRVTLHPSYLVSLYDPKYSSLAANNKLPVRKHRLIDLSLQDKLTFDAEVAQSMTKWRDDSYGQLGSGIDWSSIAQAVVERNGDRLAELRELLNNTSSDKNITEIVSYARLISFALVMPYVDAPSVLASSATKDSRKSSLYQATLHCTSAFTGHLDDLSIELTAQEHRLRGAVEGVLSRICKFATGVLENSFEVLEELEKNPGSAAERRGRQMLSAWNEDLMELMDWLSWAMWQRCPQACSWDEQCFVPMWPIYMGPSRRGGPRSPDAPTESEDELIPRCVKMDEFIPQ